MVFGDQVCSGGAEAVGAAPEPGGDFTGGAAGVAVRGHRAKVSLFGASGTVPAGAEDPLSCAARPSAALTRALSRHNRKWWRLACQQAGLPTGTPLHDLRHAGLTITSTQSGATLKELMALAGHSSPRAALIYQHAASARAVVVADAVSARLSRPSGSGRADPPA